MTSERTRADFERARHRAFLRDLRALLTRHPNELVPYHELRRRVAPEHEAYRGVHPVPLDQIVGSMDRFGEFDRAFLPRQTHTAARWQNIDRAYYEDRPLPPVQLYKVGDIYFVKDGNHRVSVAREKGQDFIDAEVIEGHVRAPLYASMSPQQLLLQAEYAEFLRRTELDRTRPTHDIRPTALGRYDELWHEIEAHRRRMESRQGRAIAPQESAADWYDQAYLPIVNVVRARGILDQFPNRTEADAYLWVLAHREALARNRGRRPSPTAAAEDYANAVATQSGLRAKALASTRALLRAGYRTARAMQRRQDERKPPTPPPMAGMADGGDGEAAKQG